MSRNLVLRIAFCIAWTIFASELFLRFLHPVPMLPRYVQSTPYGIRANMPLVEYWHSTPDYSVQLRTNAHGMRSQDPITIEKPRGTKRIVMLGDSFGMGFGASYDETFLSQMAGRLAAAGHPVEPLNLCVSGHGNAEQLIELKERALQFDPNVVVVAWHHSDLDDNVRSGLFKLDGEKLVRARKSYLPGTAVAERLFRNKAYRWLAGNCQLYTWSREMASNLAQQVIVSLRTANSTQVRKRRSQHVAAESKRGESMADRLSIALLLEMKRVTEEHGARFVVLIVPRRYNRTRFATDFPIEQGEDTHGLDIVNPLPRFEEHAGELIYWEKSHFHFTPLGNQLVGEALADHVIENGLLE